MSFEINFSLKDKYPANQPNTKLLSGIYKGTIGDCIIKDEGKRILFVIEVIEDPDMTGLTAVSSLRIPTSEEDKVLFYWRALAESCNYSPEEINDIEKWNKGHFQGRTCHFEFIQGDKAKRIYPEVTWLTPRSYRILKKRHILGLKGNA